MGDTRPCPFCAEEIKKIAVKCRFCNSDLTSGAGQPAPSRSAGVSTRVVVQPQGEGCFLQTLNAGCAAVALLVLLVLGFCFLGSLGGG